MLTLAGFCVEEAHHAVHDMPPLVGAWDGPRSRTQVGLEKLREASRLQAYMN